MHFKILVMLRWGLSIGCSVIFSYYMFFFVAILRILVAIKSYPMLYVNVISLFPLKNAR